MAGNEYYPTRPHEAQDRTKVAAGSPLAIAGLILEAIRSRFSEDAGLGVVWRDDVATTDIIIELGYGVESESRNPGRAVYVNRTSTSPSKPVLGDRAGVHLPSHTEFFFSMMAAAFTVDCVANDLGDSAILADIVQSFLMCSKRIFEGWYGIHDFSNPDMGATSAYTHDQEKWSTPISFGITYTARWSTEKIRPLIQDIGLRIAEINSEQLYTVSALSSLQRASVVTQEPECTPVCGHCGDALQRMDPAPPYGTNIVADGLGGLTTDSPNQCGRATYVATCTTNNVNVTGTFGITTPVAYTWISTGPGLQAGDSVAIYAGLRLVSVGNQGATVVTLSLPYYGSTTSWAHSVEANTPGDTWAGTATLSGLSLRLTFPAISAGTHEFRVHLTYDIANPPSAPTLDGVFLTQGGGFYLVTQGGSPLVQQGT